MNSGRVGKVDFIILLHGCYWRYWLINYVVASSVRHQLVIIILINGKWNFNWICPIALRNILEDEIIGVII